jgi:hypothetical protein
MFTVDLIILEIFLPDLDKTFVLYIKSIASTGDMTFAWTVVVDANPRASELCLNLVCRWAVDNFAIKIVQLRTVEDNK